LDLDLGVWLRRGRSQWFERTFSPNGCAGATPAGGAYREAHEGRRPPPARVSIPSSKAKPTLKLLPRLPCHPHASSKQL
jgi:hypothetical protein